MAKNEITPTNQPVTGALALQNKLLAELQLAAETRGQDFTEYGKKCVVNAIASIIVYNKKEGIDLTAYDPSILRVALQNVGDTELNIAAMPSECFLDIRKDKNGRTIKILPQGAGYEKLLRNYGVNVKEVRTPWIIREGDEFTYPSYDGLDVVPPKWSPKSYDAKPIMVVFPIIKKDGYIEYLISTRNGVKANLIAHIRQNTLYTFKKEVINKEGKKEKVVDEEKRAAFYNQLNIDFADKSLDECLAMEKYHEYINDTYLAGSAKESMIIRKMKNNAVNSYPKEYRDTYMAEAVKNMTEDYDESLDEDKLYKDTIDADITEKVEKEINEEPQGDAVPDFEVENESKEESEEVKEEKKETVDEKKPYGF